MTKKTTVSCDKCQIDITNSPLWTVSYQCDALPALNNTMHFCSYECMYKCFEERIKPLIENQIQEPK